MAHGSTDDVGYHAVEQRHYISDLQATILDRLGLDFEKMEIEVEGRPVRLAEGAAGPIAEICL